MARRYKPKVTLTNGHVKGITAVAFSIHGRHIATAALDGDVCIWRTNDGQLLHRFSGQSPVLCLIWASSGEETLLFGTKDGNVTMLTISTALVRMCPCRPETRLTHSQSDFSMGGFWAHQYPVEKLAILGNFVASGAFGQLKVWQWHPLGMAHQPSRCTRSLSHPDRIELHT